jgi:S-adenosyl-L-methionine hydrolase (adenosine-forming)
MPVITVISDWKNSDYYVAALKGSLYRKCPGAEIVDISHQIQQFGLAQAAFVLGNSYRYFPEGSVHIIAVKAEATEKIPYVIVNFDGHFFVGCDNGIFGLLTNGSPLEAYAVYPDEKLSPVYEAFSHLASELINGRKPSELGEKYDKLFMQVPLLPAIDEAVINGSVIYIDSFSNAITNITEELFHRIGKNRKFEIFIQSNHYKITRLNKTYSETSQGELLAIFNSGKNLEIAINNGNAAELLNLGIGSVVRIKFK